ncbi:HEPN domain-containing protein [Pedobacter sp. KBW01]|uniref:HEPN domain-containing protein n=1 Tax=Pedobacter sp. KBW01 TaxID=2153364 RepID=UPI000F597D79|nr:HEPN domain-containing protein [Pedobacter sp. KBW01]
MAFKTYSGPLADLIIGVLAARPDLVQNGSESQTVQYRELEGYTYAADGPRYARATYQSRIKRTWLQAGLILSEPIMQCPEYTSAEAYLADQYKHQYTPTWFKNYLFQLVALLCEYSDAKENGMADELDNRLIASLYGNELPITITIQLQGLLLESRAIGLADGITLRQPVQSDFEQIIDPLKSDFSHTLDVTAILEIKGASKKDDTSALDKLAEQIVCKLQLFCTCSIHEISYVLEQKSLNQNRTSHRGQNRFNFVFSAVTLKSADERKLKDFIQDLSLPAQLTTPRYQHQDFLTSAFDRYNESLLEKVALERRITNAVMGIEALLSAEKQELSFRIQTRTARLLSLLDEVPALEIRRILATAYSVRSNYAHGGFLDNKAKGKITRDFGELDTFAKAVIDALRKLILIFISIAADKTYMLQLIDDSLIDELSLEQLRDYVMPAATFYR